MARSKTKKGSMKYQAHCRMAEMAQRGFGTSKHDDQVQNKEETGRYVPAQDKIYSSNTERTYMSAACTFLSWCADHGYRGDLDDQRSHVPAYLADRQHGWTRADGRTEPPRTAATVYRDAAALAKLYATSIEDWRSCGAGLPRRSCNDITRGRDPGKWEGRFSEERHRDLVDFCKSCGLRRAEILDLAPDDVYRSSDGSVHVHVLCGKGGKERTVTALDDTPLRLAEAARAKGRTHVFAADEVPQTAPTHWYRSDFARAVYDSAARDVAALPRSEQYRPRGGGMDGMILDRAALRIVSRQLGHSRVDVVPHHYLYPR